MNLERWSPWTWTALLVVPVLLGNHWALREVNPTDFQRLGTIWICLSIVVLARFVRGFVEQLTELRELKALWERLKASGESEGDGSSLRSEIAEHEVRIGKRELAISRQIASLTFFETVVLCVGTIQTGYGELFHCWFNGKGWTTC